MLKKQKKAGLIAMHLKKKASYIQRKEKNQPNKKLIIWISSLFAVIVVLMAILLILSR